MKMTKAQLWAAEARAPREGELVLDLTPGLTQYRVGLLGWGAGESDAIYLVSWFPMGGDYRHIENLVPWYGPLREFDRVRALLAADVAKLQA